MLTYVGIPLFLVGFKLRIPSFVHTDMQASPFTPVKSNQIIKQWQNKAWKEIFQSHKIKNLEFYLKAARDQNIVLILAGAELIVITVTSAGRFWVCAEHRVENMEI